MTPEQLTAAVTLTEAVGAARETGLGWLVEMFGKDAEQHVDYASHLVYFAVDLAFSDGLDDLLADA